MITRTNRFQDAPWFVKNRYKKNPMCIIGGAGGIGSWLTMLLARADFNPIVFDFDTIEPHNMGGQLFPMDSVGKTKVEAIKEVTQNFVGKTIETFNEKYDKDSMTHSYVFAGFDNMAGRRIMFENWRNSYRDNPNAIFIDGRLNMEQLQIFCVTKDNADYYEENYLFDDSDVEDAPCSAKQTSHTAAMIAGLMVGFFTNHITNVYKGAPVRRVPFMYEYFIPLNLTTTHETISELLVE